MHTIIKEMQISLINSRLIEHVTDPGSPAALLKGSLQRVTFLDNDIVQLVSIFHTFNNSLLLIIDYILTCCKCLSESRLSHLFLSFLILLLMWLPLTFCSHYYQKYQMYVLESLLTMKSMTKLGVLWVCKLTLENLDKQCMFK